MSERPPDEPVQFERIDWNEWSGELGVRGWRLRVFLAGILAFAGGFYYEHFQGRSVPFLSNLEPMDWLLAASLLSLAVFVVVPLVQHPAVTKQYWQRLREHRFGLGSLVFVALFFAVGLLGPLFVSEPTEWVLTRSYQPPVYTTVDTQWLVGSCVGEVTNGRCHGTWQYPLGTTRLGKDMIPFLVLGARTSLKIATVSAALIIPTGLSIGLLAAHAGGTTDRLLMRFAELLQTVPAVVVYLLFSRWNNEYRLVVLVVIFGLTCWGGLARLVRNEALQLQDRQYVKAAETSGADGQQVMRWHLLPNISRSVLTNVTLQVPLLILTEAALSFIILKAPQAGRVTLGDPTIVSWGQTIHLGIRSAGIYPAWWIATFPSVLLVLTVLSFNLLGRTLGDVLDPKSN